MTNKFIANGEILDTDMSIEDIEFQVQDALDENTSGIVNFRILELSEKEVRMVFIRDFICADPNKHIISDKDMAIITGLSIAVFQPSEVGGYPIIYPLKFIGKNFYSHITAFIRLYKLLLARENQGVEHIGIRTYSDRILMQLIF